MHSNPFEPMTVVWTCKPIWTLIKFMDRTIISMWVRLFDFAGKVHSLNHRISKGMLSLLLGLKTWKWIDRNTYSMIWWYFCQTFKLSLSFLLIFVYKNLFALSCYLNSILIKPSILLKFNRYQNLIKVIKNKYNWGLEITIKFQYFL